MMVFVSAAGQVPLVYFCLKTQKHVHIPLLESPIATRSSNTLQILLQYDSMSESGYMAEHHFLEALPLFGSAMALIAGQHPILLLANNLHSHQTLAVLKLVQSLHIYL
jgi:hypothetical protein